MKVHSKSEHLLILSCSRRKNSASGLLPAIERYDGPAFRVLRRFLRSKPAEQPDVYILSAEFGLIPSDKTIAHYDLRMTPQRAQELKLGCVAALKHILEINAYQELCICAGRDYLLEHRFSNQDGVADCSGV